MSSGNDFINANQRKQFSYWNQRPLRDATLSPTNQCFPPPFQPFSHNILQLTQPRHEIPMIENSLIVPTTFWSTLLVQVPCQDPSPIVDPYLSLFYHSCQCLALLSFKRLAKILLKHKHLDNEGKLELLHMMSNESDWATQCTRQDKMSNEELKLQDPRCRIRCPGHPARKYWTHKSVISLTD